MIHSRQQDIACPRESMPMTIKRKCLQIGDSRRGPLKLSCWCVSLKAYPCSRLDEKADRLQTWSHITAIVVNWNYRSRSVSSDLLPVHLQLNPLDPSVKTTSQAHDCSLSDKPKSGKKSAAGGMKVIFDMHSDYIYRPIYLPELQPTGEKRTLPKLQPGNRAPAPEAAASQG